MKMRLTGSPVALTLRTSASHACSTGKQGYVDSAGRVEKFLKKYEKKK